VRTLKVQLQAAATTTAAAAAVVDVVDAVARKASLLW
jgi:hypothetical protein